MAAGPTQHAARSLTAAPATRRGRSRPPAGQRRAAPPPGAGCAKPNTPRPGAVPPPRGGEGERGRPGPGPGPPGLRLAGRSRRRASGRPGNGVGSGLFHGLAASPRLSSGRRPLGGRCPGGGGRCLPLPRPRAGPSPVPRRAEARQPGFLCGPGRAGPGWRKSRASGRASWSGFSPDRCRAACLRAEGGSGPRSPERRPRFPDGIWSRA